MNNIYWLDIETTGLDCNKDAILEIAVAEAKFSDPFNFNVICNQVLWFSPDLVNSQSKFIIGMHTKNGLWSECADKDKTLDAFEIQDALLELIPKCDNGERHYLAGSSIHFDHSFIKMWMPKLAERFSHRHYDVSSLKLFCESRGMTTLPKAGAHRALDDIKESIARAKMCEDWLKTGLINK